MEESLVGSPAYRVRVNVDEELTAVSDRTRRLIQLTLPLSEHGSLPRTGKSTFDCGIFTEDMERDVVIRLVQKIHDTIGQAGPQSAALADAPMSVGLIPGSITPVCITVAL